MAVNTTDMITTPDAPRGLRHKLAMTWVRVQSVRPGDAGTAARAQLRIMKTLGASGTTVRTSAVGGYVELRGTVSSRNAMEKAAEAARSTFGAKGVLNFLDIK